MRVVDGSQVILDGYDAARPLRMSWDDVVFDKPADIKVNGVACAIRQGPGPSNLRSPAKASPSPARRAARVSNCERKFALPERRQSTGRRRLCRGGDARFNGNRRHARGRTPTFRTSATPSPLPANGPRARSCSSAMAAIARSSPSTDRASRCSANRATGRLTL